MGSRHVKVAVVGGGSLVALFLAARLGSWGDEGLRDAIELGVELTVSLGVAASCGMAARRSTGTVRIAWACWALYGLLFAAGSAMLLGLTDVVQATPGTLSLTDVTFLTAVPAGVAGVLLLSRRNDPASGAAVALLDGILFGTSLLVTGWVLVLGPIFNSSPDGLLVKLVSVASPTADALLLTVLAIAITRAKRDVRTTLCVLAAGIIAVLLADSSLAFQTAAGVLSDHTAPLDAGWIIGLVAIGCAARLPRDLARAAHAGRAHSAGFSVLMPLLSIAVALGFAITGYLRSSVFSPVEVWALLVLIATAVVRQSVALYANGQMRRRLEYQTVHDDLTGLKNRRFLRALLDSTAPELDAASWQLLMIDLDDFKSINDSFGHSVGDALLVEISRLLRSAVRSTDVIAHLGGDEFAVAVHGDRVDATDVARRILSALDDPIPLGDITARVGASIGVVTSDGAPTAEVLLRNADLAMYAAKAQGGHQFTLYTPSMHQAVAERVHLEAELRAGWNTEQLIVHFQPIVELATGRVVSMEALVRWQHPERGLIAPDSFIPIAEETGLIVPLGERILRMSCNALATLQRRHPTARDISVSVNVSARQLRSVHLVKTVSEALRSSGLHPGQLTLEVTETAVIRDLDHSIRILNDLRALGVRIALDDFGVGNASIGNLRRLPVDVIKIDKSLVDHIPDGRMATGLLDAVAAMASALNLRTVIEGVERSDQAAHLREAGYDMAQGYYFARPADAVAIDRILVRGFLEGTDAVQTGHRTAPGSGTEATETMLVVEDEDLLAVIVRRLLANEGIRAVTARTLAEARAALETTAYAAVLTDITLPDGIGWDLVEELRARKATANTPIVVMTAIPDDADVLNRAMRLRCEYLGKPFQGPALLAKLAKARARSGSGEVLVRTRASRPSIVAAAAL